MLSLVERIFNKLEQGNWPAKALLLWFLLMMLAFYPFALSVAVSQILKQGIFVLGGIICLLYLVVALIAKPQWGGFKSILVALLAVVIVSGISTILSSNVIYSLVGLRFETETYIAQLSFFVVILAAQIAFRGMSLDFGKIFLQTTSVVLLIPYIIFELIFNANWLAHLYLDQVSLQSVAVINLVLAAYYIDFKKNQSHINISIYSLYFIVAMIISFLSDLVILPMIGIFLCLLLIIAYFSKRNQLGLLSIPAITILALVLFSVNSYRSLMTDSQNNYYFDAVKETFKAIETSFVNESNSYLFGVGPGNYYKFIDKYRTAASNGENLWTPNYEPPYFYSEAKFSFGLIPKFIISTGLLGFVSWLSFIILVLYLVVREMFNNANLLLYPNQIVLIGLVLVACLTLPAVYLISALTLSLGIFLSNTKYTYEISWLNRLKNIYKDLFVVTILILILPSLYSIQFFESTALSYQKSLDHLLVNNKINVHLDYLLEQRQTAAYYRTASLLRFKNAEEILANKESMLEETSVSSAKKNLGDSLLYATKATKIDPNDYRNWIVLAEIKTFLMLFGADELYGEITNDYARAIRLSPMHYQPFIGLATASYIKGEYIKAKDYLDVVDSAKLNLPSATELRLKIDNATNNVEALQEVEIN